MTPDPTLLRPFGAAPSDQPEIEKLSEDLGEAFEQLMLIYRTVHHLGASFDLDPITRQLVDRVLDAAPSSSVALYLADGRASRIPRPGQGLEVVATRGERLPRLSSEAFTQLAGSPFPRFFSGEAAHALVEAKSCSACNQLLVAPLEAGGRALGLLVLARAGQERYTTVEAKLVGALCDVTAVAVANWQHYRAITNEREMLYGVIREIGDGIVIATDSWQALHTNRAARSLLSVHAESGAAGERRSEGYDALERLLAFRLSVPELELRAGVPEGMEFRAESRDPRRPLVLTCRVFRAQFGAAAEPVLVLHLRDVTRERHEAEAQRDFMSLASHKLRTPLTKISGLLPILADENAPKDLVGDALRGIDQGATELAGLIDGVLEFVEYRRTDHATEELDLAPLVRAAIDAVVERRRATLPVEVKCDPSTPRVIGSPRMLRRLVESLVDNAIKFSPGDAAPVVVEIAPLSSDGVVTGASIVVRDHGEGMAPELIERAFLPFAQRDIGFTGQDVGAGLGLLLAREVALRHGGRLSAESELGRGSVFRAEIPSRGFQGARA